MVNRYREGSVMHDINKESINIESDREMEENNRIEENG
jgi:hypothetical protein